MQQVKESNEWFGYASYPARLLAQHGQGVPRMTTNILLVSSNILLVLTLRSYDI